MKILINGLTTAFARKYPLTIDNKIIYTQNKRIIVKGEQNDININIEPAHFYTKRRLIFSDLNRDDAINLVNRNTEIFKPNYIDKVFPYNIYILANFFKPDIILDLDTLILNKTNCYSFSSQEQVDEMMQYIYTIIDSTIEEHSEVYYSISKQSEAGMNILTYNKSILETIYTKTTNIFIGGEFFEDICKEELDKFSKFKIVLGKNLNQFDTNVNFQKLDVNFVSELQDYTFNEKMNDSLYDCNLKHIVGFDTNIKTFIYNLSKSHYCNGVCAFCTNSAKGTTEHSVGDIEKSLVGFKSFTDVGFNSCMLLDPSVSNFRILDPLANFISRNNLKLNLFVGARLKDITEEKVALMQEIGVKAVNVGIESANDEHLKYIQKYITLKEIQEKIMILHEHNMFICTNFIGNMPYASVTEFEDSLTWIQENFNEDVINTIIYNLFILYYDCEFHRNPEKFQITLDTKYNLFQYLEKSGMVNIFNRLKNYGTSFIKNFDKLICFDNRINIVFALYEKYGDKQTVWSKFKEIYYETNLS